MDATAKAVIWDVADTLVTRVIPEGRFFEDCLRAIGLTVEPLSPDTIRSIGRKAAEERLRWRTLPEECDGFLQVARALLGAEVSDEDCRNLGTKLAHYYDVYAVIPGIRELLDDLKNRSVRQAVLAEWPASMRAFLAYPSTSR